MISNKRLVGAVLGGLAIIAGLIAAPMLFENLDSSEIMVIQSPVSGDLTAYTEPGMKWQGFGSVSKYPRRNEFTFHNGCGNEKSGEKTGGPGLGVRFYDGGNATLCGSISWMMPLDPKSIIEIHRDFHSAEAFELQAIRRSMESAAIFSGPTMSSFDSAAGRRNELLQILNEQTLKGVYKTLSKTVRAKDIAGIEKEMQIIEIVKDDKGIPIRAQESYVEKYKVVMLPMTISGLRYEDRVETQIKDQQSATNAAVVAIANAKKSDQDALTAESQGRAAAVKAEWEEKTIQAKSIATAQANVTIADAGVKEAEAFKKSEILRGEGEAARKRLVMEADGALDKKLDALIRINSQYADAIQKAQPGAWVPTVQMGSGGSTGGGSATALVDLLTAKTAKDLGVDLGVVKGAPAKK
jgi:hypothetical protein